jgi:alginate O-acetyltransferase complex protein AlgI
MNAYLPDIATFAQVAGALVVTLLTGLALARWDRVRRARAAAWGLLVLATVGTERLCAQAPPGFRMLAIIGALFLGMKALVSVEARAAGEPGPSPRLWLAFALLWPGMRPVLFAKRSHVSLPDAGGLIRKGAERIALGVALVLLARLTWLLLAGRVSEAMARIVPTLLLLPGLSLLLHFGLFDVAAGIWRWRGVACRPLFRAPLRATSLTDFWSRRWNLAFAEMTAIGIYRPLEGVVGRRGATLLAFLASGLLHELAISLPVRAGFGLPTLYFLLHGSLVLWEKHRDRVRRPSHHVPWLGRLWTLAWLALPLPILFHPWFLRGVVWPLIGMD